MALLKHYSIMRALDILAAATETVTPWPRAAASRAILPWHA
ncbi:MULTISPECIES: hypothetical protein [Pseudomonas]|uniref:Uncharacterized protein n=1 Tax=Pseudomonas flavocrustae TaxID=2991719 RepID=A0ABT6IGF1_9PSED|nr:MULTISPECIES: hypothetical protein [unclassified Pseudomonas]MDH4763562.1 hypothetical protein [Pseudomonas sp. CBMAI 2609]